MRSKVFIPQSIPEIVVNRLRNVAVPEITLWLPKQLYPKSFP